MVGQVSSFLRQSALGAASPGPADADVWRRSLELEATDDEAERFLVLAAVAEGRLDADEQQLLAEWLVRDPALSEDIAAAARPDAGEGAPLPEAVLARAVALVPDRRNGNVIALRPRQGALQALGEWAGWGSFVAAMAVASWLGFTLGVDTSRSLDPTAQSADDGVHELLDPSSGFMRDMGAGSQT